MSNLKWKHPTITELEYDLELMPIMTEEEARKLLPKDAFSITYHTKLKSDKSEQIISDSKQDSKKIKKIPNIVDLPIIGAKSADKLAKSGIITLTDFVKRFEEVCKITGYTAVQLTPALEIAKANITN